eukprot:306661-Chlamydomonas_euryale.AAC.3
MTTRRSSASIDAGTPGVAALSLAEAGPGSGNLPRQSRPTPDGVPPPTPSTALVTPSMARGGAVYVNSVGVTHGGGSAGDAGTPTPGGTQSHPQLGFTRRPPPVPHPMTAALALEAGINHEEDRTAYEEFVAAAAKAVTQGRSKQSQAPYQGEKRNKTHWDHLLEEMEWLAKDFSRCACVSGAECESAEFASAGWAALSCMGAWAPPPLSHGGFQAENPV